MAMGNLVCRYVGSLTTSRCRIQEDGKYWMLLLVIHVVRSILCWFHRYTRSPFLFFGKGGHMVGGCCCCYPQCDWEWKGGFRLATLPSWVWDGERKVKESERSGYGRYLLRELVWKVLYCVMFRISAIELKLT